MYGIEPVSFLDTHYSSVGSHFCAYEWLTQGFLRPPQVFDKVILYRRLAEEL